MLLVGGAGASTFLSTVAAVEGAALERGGSVDIDLKGCDMLTSAGVWSSLIRECSRNLSFRSVSSLGFDLLNWYD